MDLIRVLLSILVPPLGVFLQVGIGALFWINILLTLLGYIPGPRRLDHRPPLGACPRNPAPTARARYSAGFSDRLLASDKARWLRPLRIASSGAATDVARTRCTIMVHPSP